MADDTTTLTRPRGGGSPGKASGGGKQPAPKEGTPKPPAEAGWVARNGKNLLALPVTRMKLGWFTQMTADITRFRIWIPTKMGGVLTIRYKTGTVDLRRPFKKIIKQAASEITYVVKRDEYGEFFAIANGKANEWVQCTFSQTAFSRDGTKDSDPPLVPWDFFYWPTAHSAKNPFSKGAGDLMEIYARAFGHDPAACRKAEEEDHASAEVKRAPYYDWVGHCHMAAPASALFEEPKNVVYNGVFFSSEDLKFLASEYWGNFGRFGPTVWELQRGTTRPGGQNARFALPAYFKPGDPDKDREGFAKGLMQEFRGDSPDPNLQKAAEQVADSYIAQAGGPEEFRKQINGWFGELAADFYQALIDNMLVQKHPLMANMRSYRANGGPDQVWNQVYFWYRAFYREHAPEEKDPAGETHGAAEDENYMVIFCEMRANMDHWKNGSTTGLPAEIIGNDIKPTDGNSLVFSNKWRIRFDGSGSIKLQDPLNGWEYLKNADGENLFAPTELLPLEKPLAERKIAGKFSMGNKYLSKDIVDAGLLKIHKRYK